MDAAIVTILLLLLGFGIAAPIVPVPGQYYHAPDSWASEVQIEDGRIKNTLPLDMTVQPNRPTSFNLKRLRIPYSRYSGIPEREGNNPIQPPAEGTSPMSDDFQSPEISSGQILGPNSAVAQQADGAGAFLVDDQVLISDEDELERYSKELEPVNTGYKELLREAEMGRLDERTGKGRSKRDVLNGLDGPRQLEMREYTQRMMTNVLKERKAMSERKI